MPKDKDYERITVDIHPVIYNKLKKIKEARRTAGDPCTISELVRKSIILFLDDKK